MTDATDALVFAVVVLLRLGVPLLIPRFPLPAIVAALLIDAADQTVFQQFTNLDLEGYQSYDKALDIYYLTIAYLSTLRNWSNIFAFEVSRFLWYYRLVGITAFELSGWRTLLLIFPNTFEYFFIFYEAVRSRWDPKRLTKKQIIIAAAFIWIFIKLPQEYWIHVAQLDTTDFIKEDILGVPADNSWGEAISQNLWVIPVLLIVAVILFFLVRRISRRLPHADWAWNFDADVHSDIPEITKEQPESVPSRWHGLPEKIVLVGLVSVIFGKVLPDSGASNLELFIGIAAVIVANSFVSHWFAMRGTHWRSTLTEFCAMAAINFVVALTWSLLTTDRDGETILRILVFFVLLLTLIVTFYDHYRPIYDRRVAAVAESG